MSQAIEFEYVFRKHLLFAQTAAERAHAPMSFVTTLPRALQNGMQILNLNKEQVALIILRYVLPERNVKVNNQIKIKKFYKIVDILSMYILSSRQSSFMDFI